MSTQVSKFRHRIKYRVSIAVLDDMPHRLRNVYKPAFRKKKIWLLSDKFDEISNKYSQLLHIKSSQITASDWKKKRLKAVLF